MRIKRLTPAADRIANLHVNLGLLRLKSAKATDGPSRVVYVSGSFLSPKWELIGNSKIIQTRQEDGAFVIAIPIVAKHQVVEFLAVAPDGEIVAETLNLVYVGKLKPIKRWRFSVAAGLTSVSYTEQDAPDYGMLALTLKGIVQYIIVPDLFDVSMSGFINAAPLTTSPSYATGRFYGINARFGYTFPYVDEPWKFVLMPGWYYTSMLVEDELFGFENMGGPQVYLWFERALWSLDRAVAYLKFSPISPNNNLALLRLSNREIAIGGGWVHPLLGGQQLSVMADFSQVNVVIKSVPISFHTFSLSTGYSF